MKRLRDLYDKVTNEWGADHPGNVRVVEKGIRQREAKRKGRERRKDGEREREEKRQGEGERREGERDREKMK